ncbi:hypothetical protein ACRAWD_01425 [Caulobacter segnis]
MTRELGYSTYLAQGGDWGGLVTSWLGLDHAEHVKAIHLNMIGLRPAGPPQDAGGDRLDHQLRRPDGLVESLFPPAG